MTLQASELGGWVAKESWMGYGEDANEAVFGRLRAHLVARTMHDAVGWFWESLYWIVVLRTLRFDEQNWQGERAGVVWCW